MPNDSRDHVEDLRAASQLAVDATKAVTEIVEQMHQTIASGPAWLGRPLEAPIRLVTGLVYGSIRGVTGAVGTGIDLALQQLAPLLGEGPASPQRDAVHAAVNGVLGDYLEDKNSPLAIDMQLASGDLAGAKRSMVLLVHGSCMSDRQWLHHGHDHAAALADELDATAVYVRYNSGRHVSANGDELAYLLEDLVDTWPVPLESLTIVAFSMGGLVARSACRAAEVGELVWRDKLDTLVTLGTPHHGSPLERGGNWLDAILGISRYSAPLTRLGRLRSAGITDLRYGNVLAEDWADRDRFELAGDRRVHVPLPEGVACFAVAGTAKGGGDGLVPIDSALGVHSDPDRTLAFPEAHRSTADVVHVDLLGADVYPTLRAWLVRP